MTKTLVVNFFAGPGAGKSTSAAALFAGLKNEGINCELVQEYAKDQVWGKTTATLEDQPYVFAKQNHRIHRLIGEVDVVITDSPVLTSLLYDKGDFKYFEPFAIEVFDSYRNLNFFVDRVKPYNPAGRYQSEDEAKLVDDSAHRLLEKYTIVHHHIQGDTEGQLQALSFVLWTLGKFD